MYIMLNEWRLNLLTKCVPSTLSKAAMIGLSYFVLELQDTSNLIFFSRCKQVTMDYRFLSLNLNDQTCSLLYIFLFGLASYLLITLPKDP